jgi:hypothetical protein
VVEGLLAFEVGPLGQDNFILEWKGEDAGKEVPLWIRDLAGNSLDQVEGEGESIGLEQRTSNVVVDDLI